MSTTVKVDKRSYTAAGTMPWKLLQLKNAAIMPEGEIRPLHIQLIPTNRCNGRCTWCSCSNVDRGLQLDYGEILELLSFFAMRGTRAITITGGGEPTLHQGLLAICSSCRDLGIEIGLVTNGMKWGRSGVDPDFNDLLRWVRVSTMETNHDVGQVDWLRRVCDSLPKVGIGISFTVDVDADLALAEKVCRFAEDQENLTHIRFVQNILDPNNDAMDVLKARCEPLSSKAIFQYRSVFTRGMKRCLISKLKPVIDASGLIYPCCGAQYAGNEEEQRKMPERFSMGQWNAYDRMEPFDGSICQKCYYNDYNTVLEGLTRPLEHIWHV